MSHPLRRVILTLHANDQRFEISVYDMDDSTTNRLKSAAESGGLTLAGVAYEVASKTHRKEWMSSR